MYTNKHIILQGRLSTIPTTDNLGNFDSLASKMIPFDEFEIDVCDISKKEKRDLRRDPNVHAIANIMPCSIDKPVTNVDNNDGILDDVPDVTWGIDAVRASDSPYDGTGIKVAVLDTGIVSDHDTFSGIDILQYNFTEEVEHDVDGHGTHCAGTLFGQDVLGKRIGIAKGINNVLIGKVLGEGMTGTTDNLAKGIQWAANKGAHIISVSAGIDFLRYYFELTDIHGMQQREATLIALNAYRENVNLFDKLAKIIEIQSTYGDGCVIIASSGNASNRPSSELSAFPPAASTGIVSVGAIERTTSGLNVAPFSNNQVNISAPGVKISSANKNGGLINDNGTSMATAHVSGIAALWAQRQKSQLGRIVSRLLIKQLINSGTTQSFVPNIEEEDVGTGIVQAPLA